MWLTILAAALFALVLLITLLRAEKSVANGALAVITLLAVGIAVAAMLRVSSVREMVQNSGWPVPSAASLACLDELAGDSVGAACEKAVFASAESTAAAVSYTASQISKLASYGSVADGDRMLSPELRMLRRAVERDRFGMVAHVLQVRDGCTLSKCAFFQSLTNTASITTNMDGRVYERLVAQYAPGWNSAVPIVPSIASTGVAPALPPSGNVPPGKPVSGDFPASSSSIPPINIMAPEPSAASVPARGDGRDETSKATSTGQKKPSKPRSLAPPAATETVPSAEDNR
ncbi:MAG: hypothetical protein K2W78_09840 [Xanthobacteraceae bacterium]|nr:hypothetical protein [Xanthobacteraceae bacterium]